MSNFTHRPINLDYELSAQLTDAGRLYKTPEGNYYPSVTTFLGHFTSKSIEGWKNAVGEKEANRVGHHAVTRGNAVHNTAERYLNNDQPSYIGQEQTWFFLRFIGTDQDININFEGKNSEFRSFFWGGVEHLSRAQYYKRKTYRKLFAEFSIS